MEGGELLSPVSAYGVGGVDDEGVFLGLNDRSIARRGTRVGCAMNAVEDKAIHEEDAAREMDVPCSRRSTAP